MMATVVLVLDQVLEEGVDFMIDLAGWRAGLKFRGITRIPPGIHHIRVGSSSLLVHLDPSEILPLHYNTATEELSLVSNNNVDLRNGIVAYSDDHLDHWNSLSFFIRTEKMIYLDMVEFMSFDLKSPPNPTSSPSNITKFAMDKSSLLLSLDLVRLLSDFQLAFLAVIFASRYDAFLQWNKIIVLVCTSTSSIEKKRAFFGDFISCLKAQVECEEGREFWKDVLSSTDTPRFIRHLQVSLVS